MNAAIVPLSHDFVVGELQRYIQQQHANFVVFRADPEIERQIEEMAEASGGDTIGGFRDLFQRVKKTYGDGSPQGIVASLCLTFISELELQYASTDEDTRERRLEGRGVLGDQPAAKKKIESLINRFAKQRCAEERAKELEEWRAQRDRLMLRRDQLVEEIETLKLQLRDKMEETHQPEPIDEPVPLPPKDSQLRKKGGRPKTERFAAGQTTSVPPPPIADVIEDEFVLRSDFEVNEVFKKLCALTPDQLVHIKDIVAPDSTDTFVRFDLKQIADDKFRKIKDFILMNDWKD